MRNEGFDKLFLIISILLYFGIIYIGVQFVKLTLSLVILLLVFLCLFFLLSALLLFFDRLREYFRGSRGSGSGLQRFRFHKTAERMSDGQRGLQHVKMASRGVQSRLRKRWRAATISGGRSLKGIEDSYLDGNLSGVRNVGSFKTVEDSYPGGNLSGGSESLHGLKACDDECKRHRMTTWGDLFSDLCVKLCGGLKHLYEESEFEIKLGSWAVISCERGMIISRRCSFNAEADSLKSFVISFGNMGKGDRKLEHRKRTFLYKRHQPAVRKGKDTHKTSEPSLLTSSDISKSSSNPSTDGGTNLLNSIYEQLKLFNSRRVDDRTMTNSANPALPANPPDNSSFRAILPVMPRPGQPGALYFDGNNISEFLEDWNLECEDYSFNNTKKCTHLPKYCEKEIKEAIKLLPGYISQNWTTFQDDLKGLYWQNDRPKNTTAALHQLINDARGGKVDLNVYILQYSTISETLVTQGALSTLDRVNRLLDGLSDDQRRRVLGFCVKNKWRLSAQAVGSEEPKFNELKEFVLREAQMTQMQAVYDKERAMREGRPVPHIPAASVSLSGFPNATAGNMPSSVPLVSSVPPVPSIPPIPSVPSVPLVASIPSVPLMSSPSVVDSSRNDPIAELTEKISRLSLSVEAIVARLPGMGGQGPPPGPSGPSESSPQPAAKRTLRCLWCDSTQHLRRDCTELSVALAAGRVRYNDAGRLVNATTGEELQLMFGKGGMIALFPSLPQGPSISVSTRNIVAEEMYGHLGDGSIWRTTLDFETGARTDEIVDVNVEEKRKFVGGPQQRRVRPRTDGSQTLSPPTQGTDRRTPPIQLEEFPDEEMPDAIPLEPAQPARSIQSTRPQQSDNGDGKKYRLASELSQTVSATQIGEKIMDTPVQLSFREILAVSGDIAGYLHEQTRKRRIPVTDATAAAAASSSVDVNSIGAKSYYALPSGRARVTLDGQFQVDATLDNGSEVNIMPKRIFERLNLPIDTEIRWRINAYNTDTDLEAAGPIGVCHDVPISLGGVEVRQHIFVVEYANADLILGRPWERAVRASYVNEDDGSYTVRIKSLDGRREVQFCAVKAEHERNREFAKDPVGVSDTLHLKG